MFKPQAMTKVIIAGSKDYMSIVINALYAHNAVHISDFVDEDDDFKIGKPYANATKLSERAVSLRSIASYLSIKGKEDIQKRYPEDTITDEIDEKTEHLNVEVTQVTDKISDLDSGIKDINDKKRLLDPLKSFDLPLDLYSGYRSLEVFVGTLKGLPDIGDITSDYQLETVPYGKGHVIALFVPKEFGDDVLKRLQDQGYSTLSLPEMEGTPKEILPGLDAQLIELESEKEKRQEDLSALRKRYMDYILASDEYLSIATQKAEAPLRFATTKNAFVIEGWIPTKNLAHIHSDVDLATDGHVMVSEDTSEAVSAEKVPIALENPLPSRPFETLVRAFSLPKYNEIDPTTFVALVYPFLFALMLGDIGYGVTIIVIGLLVRRLLKSKGIRDLAAILVYAGVISLAFGIIYNEFFGVDLVGKNGLILSSYAYPTIPRFDNVLTLLLVTLVIGILMLTLGYVLGFVNEYRQHGLKHAVLSKVSWLLMLYGGVLVIIEILPPLTTGTAISISPPLVGGLVLLVIGLILLLLDEGILGIAELPSLLSNVLSYTRLLSIGIASAGIALAVNRLSYALFIDKGGVWIIFGVLMLIVGHAVNTALGILDSGLQSLRLHYVEFFTKFYRGGGMKYEPFGYERKYTEEQ
ncbi:MAG TPA: V-type ATP synthase subunit I [Candidatus Bathyarchaeia archaeon]|nr:V-type ATP synthase subunit I [Candidatus Bathyarchaeia archaeon]